MEIQAIEAPSSLLDTTTFLTTPFNLDDFVSPNSTEVPVTDTRQLSDTNVQTGINLNVNVGLNTLTPSVNNSFTSNLSLVNDDCTVTCNTHSSDMDIDRTIGCSMFSVFNSSAGADQSPKTCTNISASPKVNSVNCSVDGRMKSGTDNSIGNNSNGLLPQFGFEGMISIYFLLNCEVFNFQIDQIP